MMEKNQIFSKFKEMDKKFFLIYGNCLVILFLVYFLFVPQLYKNLDLGDQPIAAEQIFSALFWSTWLLTFPLIGRFQGKISRPKEFIIFIFLIKVIMIIILDVVIGRFHARLNFEKDYAYGMLYLGLPPDEIIDFYYPPANGLYFAFMVLINPWQSSLVYRLVTLIWEFGTYFMVYKIILFLNQEKKNLKISNALIYLSISTVEVVLSIFHAKFDFFVIFLSIIGIYFTLKKRWFFSGLFLVFCGFFKIYTFLWIGAILLIFVKKRDWKSFTKNIASIAFWGLIFIGIFYIIEGFQFFINLFQFGWHFTVWEEAYNLNWSYYLKYIPVIGPYMRFILIAMILLIIIFYVLKYAEKIDVKLFINITMILLVFYPSVNFHYISWLVPLISIVLLDDLRHYKRAILTLNVIHANLDMHWSSILILLNYRGFFIVDKVSGPNLFIVLITRAIIIIPMVIGFLFFIRIEKKNKKLKSIEVNYPSMN